MQLAWLVANTTVSTDQAEPSVCDRTCYYLLSDGYVCTRNLETNDFVGAIATQLGLLTDLKEL